jgi:hypothetical protein
MKIMEKEKINKRYSKIDYGYFFKKENGEWIFMPFEKELDVDALIYITDMLVTFNERENDI